MTQRVAIIPARGGSKRIPRKNIRDFCGAPIISYPIKLALTCGLFEKVIVSTDDEEIASIAIQYGAVVPFLRPARLADDFTGTDEVVAHALSELHLANFYPEEVCCIYPTTPLLTPEVVRDSHALLTKNVGLVMTGTTFPSPIQRAFLYSNEFGARSFFPEHAMSRTQDLEKSWYDAGQLYWARPDYFLGRLPIGSRVEIFPLTRLQSQDIDTSDDWLFSEHLYRFVNQKV
ncbi:MULTISPECIES: pseudaminic acid cytidylyltransferase [Deefgea]|uniref:Pseudaminic acid cytidylyltransferase n=1 Tax=Deefgea chitinilytica TaxID=570276 RepID=A0ABS2C9S6_9NEIS|nr:MULTISPECIES: pseudaminic acid cytidylyltransferase [Deefgea]MBM5570884.1 pseudaminic acid cytidylyltransferase [Deefgea chitinilytica]MBM9888113.1 pseudaminic acid cytidylyltransferase [Deefgea sp. CFH1-16]